MIHMTKPFSLNKLWTFFVLALAAGSVAGIVSSSLFEVSSEGIILFDREEYFSIYYFVFVLLILFVCVPLLLYDRYFNLVYPIFLGIYLFLKRFSSPFKKCSTSLLLILLCHVAISIYWYNQGGVYFQKDSSIHVFLANEVNFHQLSFMDNPFHKVKGSIFPIWVRPLHIHVLALLSRLPGGIPSQFFIVGQLFHLILILSIFFLCRMCVGNRGGLFISLLIMFEPTHYMTFLQIYYRIYTLPIVALTATLAFAGYKYRRLLFFVVSFAIIGIGSLFRGGFCLPFLSIPIALLLFSSLPFRRKIRWFVLCVISFLISLAPNIIFYTSNPDIKVSSIDKFGVAVAFRFLQSDNYANRLPPKAYQYLTKSAPRLKNKEVWVRYMGTSLPFAHSYINERVFAYGDTPAEAFKKLSRGGLIALTEEPCKWIRKAIHQCSLVWKSPWPKLRYKLRTNYLSKMSKHIICGKRFDECDQFPELPKEFTRHMDQRPNPSFMSYRLGQEWWAFYPVKGLVAPFLFVVSVIGLFFLRTHLPSIIFSAILSIHLFIIGALALLSVSYAHNLIPWLLIPFGLFVATLTNNMDNSNHTVNKNQTAFSSGQ